MKQSIFFAMLLLGLCVSSCGDGAGTNCGSTFSLSSEIQAEFTAFTDASTVYANDRTTENCNAYKSAAQAYVDALASFRDCAEDAGQLTEFNQSLMQAEESVDDIMC